MPGKPRARPRKILSSEIFPVCPSTDPLFARDGPPLQARAIAYLSDGNTTIEAADHERSDGGVITSLPLNPCAVPTSTERTSSTTGDDILAAISRTRALQPVITIDLTPQLGRGASSDFSPSTTFTDNSGLLSSFTTISSTDQPDRTTELGPSNPSLEALVDDSTSTLATGIDGTASQTVIDSCPRQDQSLATRLQSWVGKIRDDTGLDSACSEPRILDSPVLVDQRKQDDTITSSSHDVSVKVDQPSHKILLLSPPTQVGQRPDPLAQVTLSERSPLLPRSNSVRRLSSSSDSNSSDSSRAPSPFEPANRSIVAQPMSTSPPHPVQFPFGASHLAPLKAMFTRNQPSGTAESFPPPQLATQNQGHAYSNITTQGSSNNIFGDNITHIHNKQSAAVTATVATSSATGGFLGGVLATKSFSQRSPSTISPAPAQPLAHSSKIAPAPAHAEPSFLSSAGDFLSRIVNGPPPPPDPGPVKIGELTRDCLQAMMGGKDRLKPAPAHAIATKSQDMDPLAQALLTRMVAQTVLTATSLPQR